MSKKELAVKEETAIVIPEELLGDWGASEDLESTDIVVPKIYHQQATSKFAKDGLAKSGDFCDSLTGEVLGKRESGLEVIIFGLYKTMIVTKYDPFSKKFGLDKIITVNQENAREIASYPFSETIDGVDYKNNLYYNYYCLVPGKIDELPYVLSFGSTKTKAAKKLNTMLTKLSTLKRPSASIVFEINSVLDKNDKGDWYGVEASQGRNSTAEELASAKNWYLKSKTQKFTVTEEEHAEPVVVDDYDNSNDPLYQQQDGDVF